MKLIQSQMILCICRLIVRPVRVILNDLTRDIRFWPYCPSKSFIPHYQQARHAGYTSCILFGQHKVLLWPQSLPLAYSGSIAIYPTKKQINKQMWN